MATIRVYLVDDDPVFRESVRRWLERDQDVAVVGEADSAEEALAQVRRSSPQLVLMDIRLPGISGIEATRWLKSQHPDLCVVILSAFGHEYLAQALEAGADGYLLKTAMPSRLVAAVKQALEGQRPIDSDLTATFLRQLCKPPRFYGPLTRQLALPRWVAQGILFQEVAAHLAISYATFKRDMQRIFDFLGVSYRNQAGAEAYKRELLLA